MPADTVISEHSESSPAEESVRARLPSIEDAVAASVERHALARRRRWAGLWITFAVVMAVVVLIVWAVR